jgi:hypothetical protein
MFIQIYLKLILKLKSNNESTIKNIKITNFGYENKVFKKSKYIALLLP